MSKSIQIDAINPYVTCPICGDHYDKDIHKPKILKCGHNPTPTTHSLCIVCLKELIKRCREDDVRDTFICPICRYEHQPPPIEVDVDAFYIENSDLLRLNYLLQDQSRRKEPRQLHKCENCDASDYAEAWCEDCSRAFCKACRETHDRLPFPGHRSISVHEVDWKKVKRKDFCQEHKGEEISMVCTCIENKLVFVCKVCEEDSHKGHDSKDLKTEAEAKLSEVTKLYEQAVERNRHDLDYKQRLDATTKILASNLSAAESKLNACQEHVMKMIQMQHERERKELNDIKENRTTLLSKESEQNKDRCSTFGHITNEFDTFQLASSVNILKDTNHLRDALKEHLAINGGNAPATNAYVEMKCLPNDCPFKRILQETVQMKTLPTELEVYHPEVAFRDHEFKLIIQTFSDFKKLCRVGGLPVKVKVHSPFDKVQDNCIIYPISSGEGGTSGQYVVNFVPKSTGEYKFHVYIEESTPLTADVCVSVHQLEVSFDKVVPSGQYCQIQASFRDGIDSDIVQKLNVKFQDDVGNCLEYVIEDVNSQKLITRCQPNYLGKLNMFITVNDFRIAGPFVTATWEGCKDYLASGISKSQDEIIDLISDGNTPYFSILNDNIDSDNTFPNVMYFEVDEAGTMFVLISKATITSANIIESRTTLTGYFQGGERDYNLKDLKNSAAGFAISSSGEFAVSDCKENCIFIFQTPKDSEDGIKNLEPIRKFGEGGSQWGSFNNPTALRINNGGNKLYVCDSGNGRVQELDMNGEPLNVFGPEVLGLNTPEAISLSPEGYLLILDKQKLVTIDVNSCSRRTVYQVEICCEANVYCNFNHLICCISEGKMVHLCCKNNSLRIFKYRPMQKT